MTTDGYFLADWRRPRRGFTLIELLVAAALTVLIAGLVVGLIAATLTRWNRAAGALATESQARQVFDQLTRDLQGAWYRDDGKAWLVATVQATTSGSGVWVDGTKPADASLNVAAADLTDARFGVAGVWLRFVTTTAESNVRSDEATGPVAVSYQLIRRAPSASSQTRAYLLYRAEVTPSATFLAGYDLAASAYTTAADVEGTPGNLVRPSLRQVLATNVIDFGVRFHRYVPDASTGVAVLRQVFPRDPADLEYRARLSSVETEFDRRMPAVADVLLRVLTDEGARQIAALEAGRITGDWWTIANANSKVFVRRIALEVIAP